MSGCSAARSRACDQSPIGGTSFLYSLNYPEAAERHTTQYFEMHGNRGVFHEGWTAVTKHRTPWTVGQIELSAYADDVWELYDTTSDWTQARDVAAEHPEKLRELQALFVSEAEKYHVFPLDDRFLERLIPELSGRATPKSIVLDSTMSRLHEDSVPNVKNTSFHLTAALVAPDDKSDGVVIAQGGRFGGWAVYLKNGHPTYVQNYCGVERTHIATREPVPAGEHTLELRFDYDGGGVGRGGTIRLFIDGAEHGSGRVERTVPFGYSMIETTDVGFDHGTPVTDQYSRGGGNPYTGVVKTVAITIGDDTVEPPESEVLRAAMVTH